ncbi:MAG: hypothetical protein ACO36N_02940, partial [Candidatus Nanopelagicales bacterium]
MSKKNGKNYKIAVVGVGQMGRGFASQCNKFPGLDVACLVDLDIDRIRKVFKEITDLEPVISGDFETLLNALENNQPIGFT